MKRLSYLSTILLAGVLMAGCDALAGALGVDAVDVPLDGVGSLAVNGTAVAVESGSTTRSGGKLPNLFDLESIEIPKENVKFTESTSKNAVANGNIYVTIFMGPFGAPFPLASATITIANNVVTKVSPVLASVVVEIQQRCALTGSGCPSPSAYNGKSVSDIKKSLEDYLRGTSNINYSVVTTADAGVRGSVTISGATINLDF